ncbi:MAG: folylpolyglutamate synthase/dihydrofolate synthase family protein [Gemmatimonadales bacterium]|nr:folylpolyglutamate synthase/dihydrofolate synthase family protein [Gemmatimonadales bacterium]
MTPRTPSGPADADSVSVRYRRAVDFLFPRTTTIKFGLDRTERLLERLGNPHLVMPTIHIGGTNGKGSVTTLVAAALSAAGWRVGVYTSPHLVDFRERITVAGVPISEAAVATWTEVLHDEVEALGATFFEASTAIAFADLAARGAEIAVIEVGLGGRLDSTNVVRPVASGVTKIAMDHQKYLGDTLEAIAREKAWIAKPGVPFVIGERDPEVVAVLKEEARRAVRAVDPAGRADLRVLPPEYEWRGPLGLIGAHQRRNAAVAHGILMALPPRFRPNPAAVEAGFATAFIPGRLDRRGRWLFDVAHNPDGVRALVQALADLAPPRPLTALVSILGDKEWPEMLVGLDRVVDRGVLTVAPTAASRRWDLEWLARWLDRPDRPPARASWKLIEDFPTALAAVQEGAGTVLVTGSFHTVGDVMAAIGLTPV